MHRVRLRPLQMYKVSGCLGLQLLLKRGPAREAPRFAAPSSGTSVSRPLVRGADRAAGLLVPMTRTSGENHALWSSEREIDVLRSGISPSG